MRYEEEWLKMKKSNLSFYISLGITFVLFNLIAFLIPTAKTATFWTAYAFTAVAFAAQIPFWKIAFGKSGDPKSKYHGIPIFRVGITYLIIQLIAFAIFMILQKLPVWLAVLVCSIILAISVLRAIAGHVGVAEINRVEEKIKVKRAFIQLLRVDIEMLALSESEPETKTALQKLAEKVRFSDPMSHEMLSELESRMIAKVDEMKTAVDKTALILEIDALLTERNKKCTILK